MFVLKHSLKLSCKFAFAVNSSAISPPVPLSGGGPEIPFFGKI